MTDFITLCKEKGWEFSSREGSQVITITKKISSEDDFVLADSEYYHILSLIPTTSPGSIWGTDGGGVGCIHAMKTGVFTMNKSGCSKRALNTIRKHLK